MKNARRPRGGPAGRCGAAGALWRSWGPCRWSLVDDVAVDGAQAGGAGEDENLAKSEAACLDLSATRPSRGLQRGRGERRSWDLVEDLGYGLL